MLWYDILQARQKFRPFFLFIYRNTYMKCHAPKHRLEILSLALHFLLPTHIFLSKRVSSTNSTFFLFFRLLAYLLTYLVFAFSCAFPHFYSFFFFANFFKNKNEFFLEFFLLFSCSLYLSLNFVFRHFRKNANTFKPFFPYKG